MARAFLETHPLRGRYLSPNPTSHIDGWLPGAAFYWDSER